MSDNFLGISDEESQYSNSRFCIIPVPFEKTTTFKKGTANGPSAIIEASKELELVDEEYLIATYKHSGVNTTDEINDTDSETLINKLAKKTAGIVNDGKFPVILGGEHAITEGSALGVLNKYPDLSVLQFDAHADLRPEYEGTIYNHACAMYRIKERCRIAQVGIRSIADEEIPFINKGNVKTFFMHKWRDIDMLTKEVLSTLGDNVFITIDLDGFDPNVIHDVGTPVPDGLSYQDGLKILKSAIFNKNVVGADIVELCPTEGDIVSAFTTAKIVHKIITYQTAKIQNLQEK